MLKSLVVGAVVVYLGLGAGLFALQRKLIYLPDRSTPERAEFGAHDMEEVSYETADGLVLRAWYKAPARDDRPVIVYFHGNAGHIGYRVGKVRPYLDAGYGVFLAGYRGYGGNTGEPSEAGLYADARAALDYLAAADDPAVFYGESLGTAVAVQMATERAVRAIVLESPFSSAVDIARQRFPVYPVGLMTRDRYDSAAKVGATTAPILVVHGKRDAIIPPRFGRRLIAAAPAGTTVRIIDAAGHNDLYYHGAADLILDFLNKLPVGD
jgi:fermentation-respiration switch protein FrsA (DUF1100 family)